MKVKNVLNPAPTGKRSGAIGDFLKFFFHVINSRPFSTGYLTISWLLPGLLGFASNRDCTSTWELSFLCDQAIWLDRLWEAPWSFFYSLLVSPLVHNGIEHLLFVTVIGILIVIQPFEGKYGSRATVFIFSLTHALIGISFALILNGARVLWPEAAFVTYGFERNWMGGSVGFYAIIGAYSHYDRKRWFLVLIVIGFETINHYFFETSLHISLIHLSSLILGYWNAKVYRDISTQLPT